MEHKAKNLAAWLVTILTVGGFYAYHLASGPGGVVTLEPPPRPVPNPRLMSDVDLAVDPKVPQAPRAKDLVPIQSLFSDDFSDLRALDDSLKGKQFVFLGEASHGVAEFNWIKTRLIKYLHQEHGFEVLAFESSLMGCATVDLELHRTTPRRALTDCANPVWHTPEVEPLFAYLIEQRSRQRPLHLVGLDIQPSGTGGKLFSVEANRFLGELDSELGRPLIEAERSLLSRQADWNTLETIYSRVSSTLRDGEQRLIKKSPGDAMLLAIVQREALSRVEFVKQMRAGGYTVEASRVRDRGMAENFAYVAKKLYPGKKIIVWAHNAHIAKSDVSKMVDENITTYLDPGLRTEALFVGLYMGSGAALMNDGNRYSIPEPQSGQLSSVLRSYGWKYAWFDLSSARSDSVAASASAWKSGATVYRDWGILPLTITPNRTFDALIYIDRVTPAYRFGVN
jgi:erythromycin esterase